MFQFLSKTYVKDGDGKNLTGENVLEISKLLFDTRNFIDNLDGRYTQTRNEQ